MKGRRGFTLVELMVTSGMFVLLASAGYAVLTAGLRSGREARRIGLMVAHAQRALSAMAVEVRSAVEHDGTRLTALDNQYEGLDADTLDFIAPTSRQAKSQPGAGGRCEVGYYIDNDEGTESRWLLRREDGSVDDDPLEGGLTTLAGPCVAELNLEFYDGIEWLAGWSDSETFPRAVRIGIVVVDPEQTEKFMYFETVVSISGG